MRLPQLHQRHLRPDRTLEPPTQTPVVPTATITPLPEGKSILVTSAADSGPGTLRQSLLDAQAGDIITLDLAVFPPNIPVSISL